MRKKLMVLIAVLALVFSLCACSGEASGDMITCTVAIDCTTAAERIDEFSQFEAVIPEDGVILAETEISLPAGSTAYDFLLEAGKQNNITVSHQGNVSAGTIYIDGIGGLFEFNCGNKSGWMFSVDGEYPNYTCGNYEMEEGQALVFKYTCDMGNDIGAGYQGDE